jgi:hypothetical protein
LSRWSGLALRELEAFAGAGLPGLFALFSSWVTAKKACGFEGWSQLRIVKDQSSGYCQFDGISLSMKSAAA